jgi:modulator of FtsH protease HflC
VIIAEAEKESEIIRGEGDADAVAIFASAVGRDLDFFTFYRSMQAYREALADDNTSFVLSPDSEFFRFFDSGTLPEVEQAGAPAPEDGDEQARAAVQPPAGPEATSAARPPASATALD